MKLFFRQALRIRRIEANRFGAKLSEVEEACESICLSSLDPLITALNEKADAEIDKIRTVMVPQIGESACDSEQFLDLVYLADPVSACKEYANKIIDLKPGHNSHISQRGGQHILEILLGAESLL